MKKQLRYPSLFKDRQPVITSEVLKDLETRGLIVPSKTLHKGKRRVAEVTNRTAGEVVSYAPLSKKLKNSEISPEDARTLLLIECNRKKGARKTHVDRLLTNAFITDKKDILRKVDEWAKKRS